MVNYHNVLICLVSIKTVVVNPKKIKDYLKKIENHPEKIKDHYLKKIEKF